MEKWKCICVDCPHKCGEFTSSMTSDKAYYEWALKEDKCRKELEKHGNLFKA